jgi:hypothetical protein
MLLVCALRCAEAGGVCWMHVCNASLVVILVIELIVGFSQQCNGSR